MSATPGSRWVCRTAVQVMELLVDLAAELARTYAHRIVEMRAAVAA